MFLSDERNLYRPEAYDLRTGRAFLETDTLFPLLPSIGVTVDF